MELWYRTRCLAFKRITTWTIHTRLASMWRRKFLLRKSPEECAEKGGAIVVTSLVPRISQKVMTLPPSSVAVFISSNSGACVC